MSAPPRRPKSLGIALPIVLRAVPFVVFCWLAIGIAGGFAIAAAKGGGMRNIEYALYGVVVALSGAIAHGALVFVPWFRRRAVVVQALLVTMVAFVLMMGAFTIDTGGGLDAVRRALPAMPYFSGPQIVIALLIGAIVNRVWPDRSPAT